MEAFVYIEQVDGSVEVVQVYETIEEAQRRLFNCLQEYVTERPDFRKCMEDAARMSFDQPDGQAIVQFLYGLDHDEVALTVGAYEDLDWRESTEFHVFACS